MRLRKIDIERARRLHRRAFPGDYFPKELHTFWEATVGDETVGFCSARIAERGVFLSRVGVFRVARGKGLQLEMIKARLEWARAQGATWAVTYCSTDNFASIVNLLRAGFRFYRPRVKEPWWCPFDPTDAFDKFLFMKKDL